MTLASQWKSQFDDSEETTDNEWKPESPEHKPALAGVPVAVATASEIAPPASMPPALSRISEDSRASHRRCVNIAGIENYPELMGECGTSLSSSFFFLHFQHYHITLNVTARHEQTGR